MPASSFAHLLLPTPLGLVHYDLIEEAVFLGLDGKGRFVASPTPFREAKLAMTSDGAGFVVRALPGEAPAEVNGLAADGARLSDGDRLRLGEQTAQFRAAPVVARPAVARAAAAPAAAPSPAGSAPGAGLPAPAPRRTAPPQRVQAPRGARQAALVLKLLGAGAVVLAGYQAVHYLDAPGASATPPLTREMLPDGPQAISRPEEKGTKAYDAARELETTDLAGAVERLRAVARDFPGTGAALRATARIAEVYPTLAAKEWQPVEDALLGLTNARKYRHALDLLGDYERKYAGTEAAAKVAPKMDAVRTAAREALDSVKRRVAPLLPADPRRAYSVLITADLELPADLEAEMAATMAEVRALWARMPPKPPPTGPDGPGGAVPPDAPPTPPKPPPGTELMPPGGKPPRPPPGTSEGPAPPDTPLAVREEEARMAFEKAKADLDAKNWEAARKGFAALTKQFADTSLVAGRMDRIRAARKAADVALRGAAAFLKGEAETKNGRLEVEYEFEDDVAFLADFTLEQPFASEDALAASVRSGMVILSGSTAMMNKVVFDPAELSWEMECVADRHEDYGLFALQESKDYRAVVFDVGNTQFRLKKGDAAKVLSGHVLWLFGEGVWKDADPGERGFVRIAERGGNKLAAGERIRVRCETRGAQAIAEIHSKSDPVDLKGPLKGDDGRGIGPVRVGAFAFKGRVGVDRLKISGKPDAAWVAKQFEDLLKAAAGPN